MMDLRSSPGSRSRIALARALMRLGRFVQSTAIMVMRADDLTEFTRQTYAQPRDIASWSDNGLLGQGLTGGELALLEKIPFRKGDLLVLGVGGGREAIPLAQMGFTVTGLDFVPELVESARQNAARQGLAIQGLVQEISQLDLAAESYDVIWLSAGLYSTFPTRRRRAAVLERIRQALRPGGYLACQFIWGRREPHSRKGELGRKLVAWLTLGNLSFEPGDMLWADIEFVHRFSSEEDVRSELEESGFEVVSFHVRDDWNRGEAVLRKPG